MGFYDLACISRRLAISMRVICSPFIHPPFTTRCLGATLELERISATQLHALSDPRVDLSRFDQEVSNVCARYGPRERYALKSCLLDVLLSRRTVRKPCRSCNHPLEAARSRVLLLSVVVRVWEPEELHAKENFLGEPTGD